MKTLHRVSSLAVILVATCLPQFAHAYLGPGGALSTIGAALALIASVFVAILGFLWFPVKRLLAKRRKKKRAETSSTDEDMRQRKRDSSSDNDTCQETGDPSS